MATYKHLKERYHQAAPMAEWFPRQSTSIKMQVPFSQSVSCDLTAESDQIVSKQRDGNAEHDSH